MGNQGPKTEEGIKKVTENLPDGKEPKDKDSVWQFSEKGKKAMAKANHINQLKHGLYANIPIICKSGECPYADACYLIDDDLAPKGDPCPIEVSTIEDRVDKYKDDMNIGDDETMKLSIVRDLVNIDLQIARCNKKLAVSSDIVDRVIVAVSEDGEPFRKPEISKANELQNKLLRERRQTLKELNATPKAQSQLDSDLNNDPSSIFTEMKSRMAKAKNEDGEVEVTVKTKTASDEEEGSKEG